MKKNRMTTAVGMVDDDIVAESIKARAVRPNSIWLRIGVAAACVACVLGMAGVGAYAYYTPTSYVSLDVNPSIEYSLNAFDRVLSVKGVNDDGENILEDIGQVKIKNKSIDKAIRETINTIAQLGYFPKDSEGGVVIAVSDKNTDKAEKLSEKLKETVEEIADEEKLDVEVESMAVGEARVQEARSLGVTPGKLNLVEKLQKSAENADDINIQEWLNKPVKDIMKQTKANKALSKGKESDKEEKADKDKVLDSGVPSNAGKAENTNKPDKATDKKDNGTDKSNNSNNGNNANKSDKKDTSSSNTNELKKSDNSTNNGQSKKLETDTDASEVSSDKDDSSGKSNNSNNSGQAKKAETVTDSDDEEISDNTSEVNSDKSNSNSNSGKTNNSSKTKSAKK